VPLASAFTVPVATLLVAVLGAVAWQTKSCLPVNGTCGSAAMFGQVPGGFGATFGARHHHGIPDTCETRPSVRALWTTAQVQAQRRLPSEIPLRRGTDAPITVLQAKDADTRVWAQHVDKHAREIRGRVR